eukprot:Gb_28945 [translate_table: standard]
MAGENGPAKNSSGEAEEPSEQVVDWKKLATASPELQPVRRKRAKIRRIPESYFLPRKSIPATIAFYGSFIVAGIGAGMLMEKWIQKKVEVMPHAIVMDRTVSSAAITPIASTFWHPVAFQSQFAATRVFDAEPTPLSQAPASTPLKDYPFFGLGREVPTGAAPFASVSVPVPGTRP